MAQGIDTVIVGVDDSAPARRAVEHVTEVFDGPRRPVVVLVHALEMPLPAGLEYVGEPAVTLEAAGIPAFAEPQPTEEEIRERARRAEERLEPLRRTLIDAGWPADRVRIQATYGGFTRGAIADVIAEQARQLQADVIVVGRTRHGRLYEALLRSTGERLVHFVRGITVWVVASPEVSGDNAS